jgi:rSAM/selenodomain-associated transferase 2/rSAM/selenodomain-associated transferase 1
MKERLIVFARAPVPGLVKTRLIPALGPQGAAEACRRLTERTIGWASRLDPGGRGRVEVRTDDGTAAPAMAAARAGGGGRAVAQGDGDLGRRMARAFAEAFSSGARRVVLVGADLPDLTPAHIREAWRLLRGADLVLAPAFDGGYGLIGLGRPCPALFEDISWGSEKVFEQTLSRAAAAGLAAELLPPLRDVDRPEDLAFWRNRERGALSVIIPALNEAAALPGTLAAVGKADDVEVIVADGGSLDATAALARDAGARVIGTPPGRARQMNAGAAAAAGGILLFLHADTRPPAGFADLIREGLQDPTTVGGSFALAFEPCPPLLKINEATANWRTRLLKLPFGDQALFVRASVFGLLGGFRDLPIMEDFDLVRRLGRAGRLAFLRAPARTSSRRYDDGWLRRTLRNKAVLLGYVLGVPPERLARTYEGRGGRAGLIS